MKFAYLILILLIFFTNCKKRLYFDEKYTLKQDTNRIVIEIDKHSTNLSKCYQYILLGDTDFLAILNRQQNGIDIYDVVTRKKKKEVFIKKDGTNSFARIMGFLVKNHDTIIVVNQQPQLIGIINWEGELLKKIPYLVDIYGRKIQSALDFSLIPPSIEGNELFINQFYRADESSGILTIAKQKHSNINIKVNLNTGECIFLPQRYPEELVGHNISNMKFYKTLGYNDCFVYHFSIINGLFVSDENSSFERKTIETNYNLKLPEKEGPRSNMKKYVMFYLKFDEVQKILYDRYRECYYLVIRKRQDYLETNMDLRKFIYPNCYIIILDKNFKHMGDVYLPDNTYSYKLMFCTPTGLYISEDHINNSTYSENVIRFRLFTLDKTNN